jgi:hypothetical protein
LWFFASPAKISSNKNVRHVIKTRMNEHNDSYFII